MKELLSPAQVARAINVSESSVKRWCDDGTFKTERTAGGHRRIHVSEILRYLRDGKHRLVNPEVLGLPVTTGQSPRALERAMGEYRDAVIAGNPDVCRQIVFDLYLAEQSVATIGDQVISKAFRDLGEGWECGDVEVYQERRGCEMTLRALHELRMAMPISPATAPLALGGTTEGDNYNVPTTLVELVLQQSGWRTIQLGVSLPAETIRAAIEHHQPQLAWLSVSHIADADVFVEQFPRIQEALHSSTKIAVGGRALSQPVLERVKCDIFCDSLKTLQDFASLEIEAASTALQQS